MKTEHHVFREIGTEEIELTGKVTDIGLVAKNHNRIFRLLCAHLNPSTGEITIRLIPDNGVPAVVIDEAETDAPPDVPAACECGCSDVVCAECGELKAHAQ